MKNMSKSRRSMTSGAILFKSVEDSIKYTAMPAIFKNPFGGILFLSALFFTAFLGSVFMMGPVLPLMIINPRFFRLITDHMIGIWLALPVVLMENMFDIKFYITGDKLKHNEKSVIIMNHRTRLDWLFFWTPLLRQSSVKTEKIILKHGLKQAPGFGWAMQVASYIFLRRDWKRDEKYLTSTIDYLSDLRYTGQILIFPEGTDFCDTSKPKSDSYAKKMGLPTYDYVLHPRVTGFTYLVEELRKRNMIDCIYDVSVGYPYNLPTEGEIDTMKGDLPPEVHFHVKRHAIATIPINKEGLTKWCEQKWAEKEVQLKEFYTKDKVFVTERDGLDVETYKEKIFEETSKWIVAYVLGFWGTFTVFVLAGLLYSSIIRWHFVLASIFFIVVGIFYGGIENLTQKSFRWYNSKTGKAKIR